MEGAPRRSLTIADGMILVGASGLAMAAPDQHGGLWIPAWDSAEARAAWACLVFTIALVVLRLGSPRPAPDRLWRQPGWVACVSVAFALAILALKLGMLSARNRILIPKFGPGMVFELFLPTLLGDLPLQATLIVAASWGVLAGSGRWQAEPDWVDRAGRLLGASWIALTLASWIQFWFG